MGLDPLSIIIRLIMFVTRSNLSKVPPGIRLFAPSRWGGSVPGSIGVKCFNETTAGRFIDKHCFSLLFIRFTDAVSHRLVLQKALEPPILF